MGNHVEFISRDVTTSQNMRTENVGNGRLSPPPYIKFFLWARGTEKGVNVFWEKHFGARKLLGDLSATVMHTYRVLVPV